MSHRVSIKIMHDKDAIEISDHALVNGDVYFSRREILIADIPSFGLFPRIQEILEIVQDELSGILPAPRADK